MQQVRTDSHSGLQRSHARKHAQTEASVPGVPPASTRKRPRCTHDTRGKNCWGDVGGDDDGAGVGGIGGGVDGITTCRSHLLNTASAHHQRCVCNVGRGDAGMGMRVRGHTCSWTAVLAGEEDPPSLAVRPGPIHGMGRAARY